jgi:hypothetical protein
VGDKVPADFNKPLVIALVIVDPGFDSGLVTPGQVELGYLI